MAQASRVTEEGSTQQLRKIPKVQCGVCEKFFVGDAIFFAHLTGSFFKRERRCLMLTQGFNHEKALVKEIIEEKKSYVERTVWYLVANRASLQKAVRQEHG